MTPEQIVKNICENHTESQWTIFRYNLSRAILMLLYKIFLAGVLLITPGVLWYYNPKPLPFELTLILFVFCGIGLITLSVLLRHIYTMFFLKTNMIVFTENELIKSVRRKIQSWRYSEITNVREVVTQTKNSYPVYSVEFTDQKTGHVLELARGREFGRSQDIYSFLKTKETPLSGVSS